MVSSSHITGYTACAEQLALDPDLVRQLIADHSADVHGRCRAHHSRRESHPCSIRSLAELAVALTRSAGPEVAAHCDPRSHCDASTGCDPAPRRPPPQPRPAGRGRRLTGTFSALRFGRRGDDAR